MRKRDTLTIIERPSHNFNSRQGKPILFLVLHYTAMASAEAAIERLSDPKAEVSSHYVVGSDGAVYRLVAEENRAWHAGLSFWDGNDGLNSTSIGIEIDNPGDAPYPKIQMDAVESLCKAIIARQKIRSFYVIGHSDIAPDRKQDPGELFDWPGLAANGIGVWPTPTALDYTTSSKWDDAAFVQSLNKFGYVTKLDPKILITAFQRHYQPEVFKTSAQVGIADAETKARLACLLRRKAISDGIAARKKRLAGAA